jgi:uroporphyrinogen decarboxylase
LSRREGFDYARFFRNLPSGGSFDAGKLNESFDSSFDGFGLFHYPWPGNPEYQGFLSPLERVDDARTIAEFPMPEIRAEDLAYFEADIRHIRGLGKACSAWSGSLYELSWYLRGRERLFYDYRDCPELVELIAEKIAGFVEMLTVRNLEAGVDLLCFYDDLGTQQSMAISPEIFRKFYKPHYKRIWGMIKSRWKDRHIFLHACGNIAPIIPDLIECGLDVLNPVQPEAMDLREVARLYAKDLAFWGSVSVQRTLPGGTRDEILREVGDRVDLFGRKGGLILSPANTLGRDIPLRNIGYFIDACRRYCAG